jgi:uncharacterized protein (DUF924 family)
VSGYGNNNNESIAMSSAEEILTFWFGDLRDDEAYYEERRKLWFASDPRIDQDIKNRFLSNYEHAVAGQLQRWRDTPRTTLALILLFDQFPRNMFRGDPQAFATDAQARALTLDLIQTGAACSCTCRLCTAKISLTNDKR